MDVGSENFKELYSLCLPIFEDDQRLLAPYAAGFLSFRELPPLITAVQHAETHLKNLTTFMETFPSFDIHKLVFFVDGNGRLHPRRAGLASHLGVDQNLIVVGVAKNLYSFDSNLCVEHASDHSERKIQRLAHRDLCDERLKVRGDWFPLDSGSGEVLGAAVRTASDAKNAVYVSVGHRISLETAIKLTIETSPRYRVPEPIRRADFLSRQFLRKHNFL